MDQNMNVESPALDAGAPTPTPPKKPATPAEYPPRFVPRRDWSERLGAPFSLTEGRTYEAWHPFLREEYSEPNYDGETFAHVPVFSWHPGWTYEACGPYGEDSKEVWHGEGEQLRTVVSIHRPGKFPTRVFYLRQWRDPDGKMFGKAGLRCVVAGTFRAWLRGERWPAYAPARAAHILWAIMPFAVGDGVGQGPTSSADLSATYSEPNPSPQPTAKEDET